MYADARFLAGVAGRDGDVDVPGSGWVGEQPPQMGGAAVADDGTRAAGQCGRHFLCMSRGRRVTKEGRRLGAGHADDRL